MIAPLWDFRQPTVEDVKEVFAAVLDRAPTASELEFFRRKNSDGWLTSSTFLFSRPWRRDWPIVFFYSGCHCVPITRYWRTRADMPEVNVASALVFLLAHLAVEGFWEMPLIQALFQKARHVVVTNTFRKYPPFSVDKALAAAGNRAAFCPDPRIGSFWPVIPFWDGLEPVKRRIREGELAWQVCKSFLRGDFDPLFAERHARTLRALEQKDAACGFPLAPFVKAHFRHAKLFEEPLHGTPVLYARIGADLLTRIFGCRVWTDDEIFAEPSQPTCFAAAYPETQYEWDYFKFNYFRLPGGSPTKFYEDLILSCLL